MSYRTFLGTWDALKRMFPSLDSSPVVAGAAENLDSSSAVEAAAAIASAAVNLHTNVTSL